MSETRPPIVITPYSDFGAWPVLSNLDPSDLAEVFATRGDSLTIPALFSDWRASQGAAIGSFVAFSQERGAFAVFGLFQSGHAGVAIAALLARDHRQNRRALARLIREVRAQLPGFAQARGLHRIEARCWAAHPTAARMLTSIGFTHEADMPGFGILGNQVFRQFAYLPPRPENPAAPQTQTPTLH